MTNPKNNNDVVIIELDKPRELRFGHKAIKRLTATTGRSVEEMEEENELNIEEIELIFFYGLEKDAKANGETLTLEMMEDILDSAPSYNYLIEKMQEAFKVAMNGAGGNAQASPKQPVKRRR